MEPSEQPAALFSIIGEAPGKEEDKLGRPFIGPSGKKLRGMLIKAGIWPEEIAWMNAASCWPSKNGTTHAPNTSQVIACHGNLVAQLEASGSPFVLLVGGTAMSLWRGDLQISVVHGGVFIWQGKWVVMPIYHPAAILRNPGLSRPTQDDLVKWAGVIRNELSLVRALGTRCIKCVDWADHHDPDGVPWCERHWGKWGGQWRKERDKWKPKDTVKTRREKVEASMESMF